MSKSTRASTDPAQGWIFFGLTFVLTWIFWIPLAISGQDVMGGPLTLALVIGGFGPSFAGIIMTYRIQDREGRRDFWRRCINFKQIGLRWYAVIFLLVPVAYGLGVLIDVLLGGTAPGSDAVAQITAQPASLIGVLLIALVMGPLSEELGWRGFAVDALQSRWSALISSVILWVFWWSWHFPLFFMNGTLQSEWGFGSTAFWSFGVLVLALSVIYAWVFNNTSRSILSAILIHFMTNSMINLLAPLSARTNLLATALLLIAAIGIVLFWGPETYRRRILESELSKSATTH